MKKDIKHFRDLVVYKRAFDAAMRIFQITKAFPPEERYSLVDQIRRASRSSCSCLAEASETQCWPEFSFPCGYIGERNFRELDKEYEEIISMLNSMELNADKFCF